MEKMRMMRYLRYEYGITLQELADAAGVSVQYISDIELLKEDFRTEGAERLIKRAFKTVIERRRANLTQLEKAFAADQDGLLAMIKEDCYG